MIEFSVRNSPDFKLQLTTEVKAHYTAQCREVYQKKEKARFSCRLDFFS
jgi:hypothetical protein